MAKKTFISYSKKDKELVKGMVRLLRTQGSEVFLDSDTIKPGEQWRESLKGAIEGADQLVLFWCCHSSQSEWVRYEFEMGRELNKPIIPILCCDFPTDDEVGAFQWIDMKHLMNHSCVGHNMEIPNLLPRKSKPKYTLIFGSLSIIAALVVVFFYKPHNQEFRSVYVIMDILKLFVLVMTVPIFSFVTVWWLKRRRKPVEMYPEIVSREGEKERLFGSALKEIEKDPKAFYK